MTHKMSDQDVLEHLHQALDHIVTLIILAGCLPAEDPVPDEALDLALRTDEDVKAAQKALRAALEPFLAIDHRLGLLVEEAAHAMAARAAEVGWRLGAMISDLRPKDVTRLDSQTSRSA